MNVFFALNRCEVGILMVGVKMSTHVDASDDVNVMIIRIYAYLLTFMFYTMSILSGKIRL